MRHTFHGATGLFFRVFLGLLLALPLSASAQLTAFKPDPSNTITFASLAQKLGGIANVIIPFLIGVALAAIIWGIFRYIKSAGDTEKVAEGRKVLVYGLIALFLMLSFWGFVMIIRTSLFG